MSNKGNIHILHRQSAINYCVKNLKLLLVRKFVAQVHMGIFDCAYLKSKIKINYARLHA
jgi:hypothetical protein